jgi:hypothetical protein
MKKDRDTKPGTAKREREPYRVRLPGFITTEEIGLGQVITRAAYRVGVSPCGGCERRASILNSLAMFSGRKSI